MTIEEILTGNFARKGKKIKNVNTNRDASEKYYSEVYLEIIDDLTDLDSAVKRKDFKKFVEDNLPNAEAISRVFRFPTMETPEDWIISFLERRKINLSFELDNPGKKLFVSTDIGNDVKDWERFAMGDLHAYNAESNYFDAEQGKAFTLRSSFTKESIKDTLAVMVPQLDLERRPAMREALSYNPKKEKSLDHLLREFLKCMKSTRPNFDIKIIKHWMWQVKRFMYGFSVDDPMLINFFSQQGTGKTTFLRGLFSPIEAYSFEPKIDAVKSEGHAKLWSNKYIIFFDEIRVDSSDPKHMYVIMSNLKYLLTMDVNMYRTYYTQDMTENPRTFSAVSTSNKPLVEILYDRTGMRRFYEIECKATAKDKGYLGLPFIKHTDPEKAKKALRIFKVAWRGIDEERKEGYLDNKNREELKEIQDSYKKLDCIDMFQLHSSDSFDPYILIDDTKSVGEITKLFMDNSSVAKTKMVELAYDKGYNLETVIKYIKRIEDWKKDDSVDIGVYGGPRMPRELKDHGIFVYKHQDIYYLASKNDPEGSQF